MKRDRFELPTLIDIIRGRKAPEKAGKPGSEFFPASCRQVSREWIYTGFVIAHTGLPAAYRSVADYRFCPNNSFRINAIVPLYRSTPKNV